MYPTIEQVDAADRYQICSWWRFLPSPGSRVLERRGYKQEDFNRALEAEAKIMDRISERLKEFGGFTPEISKGLGWGRS
jgi:hypothetical protein